MQDTGGRQERVRRLGRGGTRSIDGREAACECAS